MSDTTAWYGRTDQVTDGEEVLFDGSQTDTCIYRIVKDTPNAIITFTYRTIYMAAPRTVVYSQKDFIAEMKHKYPLIYGGRRRNPRGIPPKLVSRNPLASRRITSPAHTWSLLTRTSSS